MAYRFGIAPTANTTVTNNNNIDAITGNLKWADLTVSYSYTDGLDQYGPMHEIPFKGGLTGIDTDLRDIVATTQAENIENLQYADLDMKATQRASHILYQDGVKAYEKARLALHKDSRDLWDEKVKEGSYTADAEGLEIWIDEWLLPYCYHSQLEAQYQPAIKAQTLGEGLQAHRLENLTRYETHLDRKFERTLAMLLKLKELRSNK